MLKKTEKCIKKIKHIIPISLILLYIISMQNFLADTFLWQPFLVFRSNFSLYFYFPLFFSGIVFYKLMIEEKNYPKMKKYYLMAINQNNCNSMNNLALYYINIENNLFFIQSVFFVVFHHFNYRTFSFVFSQKVEDFFDVCKFRWW